LKKSKIILGTVQFGLNYGINNSNGVPNQIEINQILDEAFQNNIKILDTAEAYGNAHDVIQAYHLNSKNRFEIITKYNSLRTDLPSGLLLRVKKIIKSLKVENLYCYMFHSYKDFKQLYSLFEKEILELKKNGLIKKLGVSIYSNEELYDLLNYEHIDVIQMPFNLFDNVYQREMAIKKAKLHKIEIHSRSTFLQGLFFKKRNTIPHKLKPLLPYLEAIDEYAAFNKHDLNTLSLCYVKSQKFIDNFLIGVESLEQMKKNINSYDNHLSNGLIEKINSIEIKELELLNPSNWI
jgi:aryl-alcohol dehydrogenase-like predicted oxidoreductase